MDVKMGRKPLQIDPSATADISRINQIFKQAPPPEVTPSTHGAINLRHAQIGNFSKLIEAAVASLNR